MQDMQTFLGQVATSALEEFGGRMDKLCMVFPTRRSKVFFTEEIKKKNEGRLLFLPEMLTLDELLEKISGCRISDYSEIGWHLLSVCRQLDSELNYLPDEVTSFGNILVSDFNQTDLNLVDPKWFFSYLSEAKALETWSPGKEKLSEYQQNYLHFWNDTGKIYHALKESLAGHRLCYQGMLYRMMAEQEGGLSYDKTIWFCGFNALLPSETKIIRSLSKSTSVSLYIDVDTCFLDEQNPAGKFIRMAMQEFSHLVRVISCDGWNHENKEIRVTGCPGNIAQLQVARGLINQILASGESPVVVVHNNSLIVPFCAELKAAGISFNLTGGIPLKSTVSYMFSDQLLHFWTGRTGKVKTEVLSETLGELMGIIGSSKEQENAILELIKTLGHNSARELSDSLCKILSQLTSGITNGFHSAEAAALVLLENAAAEVSRLMREHDVLTEVFQPHTFSHFFRQQIVHSKLQVSGEALYGVQVMGLLETRNLDYAHVIHLSCNEGNLPPEGHIPSFVPYDLQDHAGWLMQNEREYIYAFHFFRNNQRAKKIHLLYNTETDELGSGEPSRFIRTMQLYYVNNKPNISWTNALAVFANYGDRQAGKSITIEKTPDVIQRIDDFLNHSKLSATSLNALRKCSLQFYFRYLLRINEPEDEEEFLNPRETGNIIHLMTDKALSGMVSQVIDKNSIPLQDDEIEALFASAVEELVPEKDFSSGEGLMQKTYLCSTVKKILEFTISQDQGAFLVGSEIKQEKKLYVNGREIGFRGTADRVQEKNATLEILDYKTGIVDEKKLSIHVWNELGIHENRDKLFQLLFYAWLFYEEDKIIRPAIISTRSIELKKLPAAVAGSESFAGEQIKNIEQMIMAIVHGLTDKNIPIAQTQESANCERCAFSAICYVEKNEQAEDTAG